MTRRTLSAGSTSRKRLSFAQFEREVTGERIRDKIAASKKKGLWMGGVVPPGYRLEERKLDVDEEEAATVRFDDGGYSGGSMDRPALQRLLDRIRDRRVDVVVVYKVDRLTRSLDL